MQASRRNALIFAVVMAIAGVLFYKAESFWGVISSGLIIIWCLIGALPIMDGPWRFKTGLAFVAFLAACVVLWPTAERMSGGRIKCPAYFRDNIKFGIVQGLDLQGGARLVY